jgi:hypothetical protein
VGLQVLSWPTDSPNPACSECLFLKLAESLPRLLPTSHPEEISFLKVRITQTRLTKGYIADLLLGSAIDWGFLTTPQKHLDGRVLQYLRRLQHATTSNCPQPDFTKVAELLEEVVPSMAYTMREAAPVFTTNGLLLETPVGVGMISIPCL